MIEIREDSANEVGLTPPEVPGQVGGRDSV